MTEKIIVSPQRVRALGDVVDPKSVNDFDKVSCTLSSSSDTVYGTVYSESYLAGSTLSLVYDGLIGSDVDSFSVSATLKDSGGSAISSVSVYLSLNGVVTSATTNGSGVATFNVSTVEGATEYLFKVYYTGTGSVCGSYAYGCVRVGDVTGLTVNGSPSIIQSGDNCNLWATLEGTGNLQGALVKFYEVWTPSIRLSGDTSVIQSGDSVDFTAQLVDNDGSLVREAGHTISFYNEPTSNGLLFKDTTERTYTSTSTQINEKLTRIIGLSNEDFTFEYDLKNVSGTASDCSGGLNIGATSEHNPSETIANYRLFFGTDNSNRKFSFNNRGDSSNNSFGGTRSLDTWYHMKLVKTGDSFSAYVDGTLIATKTVDWWGNYDSFDIYFINWKGTSMIKNIEFKIDGE